MPDSNNIKELKGKLRKLGPKERIEKLKDLEGKKKVEIKEIEELIKDSEKELKTKKVAEEIAPQELEINIGRLFDGEAGALEIVTKEEAQGVPQTESHQYAFRQLYSDYTKLQDIAYASIMGPLTQAQLEAVDNIGERIDRTRYQTVSREIANILVASRVTLYKIRKYAGLE